MNFENGKVQLNNSGNEQQQNNGKIDMICKKEAKYDTTKVMISDDFRDGVKS